LQVKELEDWADLLFGIVDGVAHRAVEEAFNGGVEVVQRHQPVDVLVEDALDRGLEGVQQRAFPLGQMTAGGAVTADGLEYLGQQGELVGGEGIIVDVLRRVLVAGQGDALGAEGQLVVDDVALCHEDVAQLVMRGFRLGQQTSGDHFVGVGAGITDCP